MERMLFTKLVLLAVLVSVCSGQVYTSSKKIEDMVLKEKVLLRNINKELKQLGDPDKLNQFSRFYDERMQAIRKRNQERPNIREYLNHPNAVYYTIKEYAQQYKNIRSVLERSASPNVIARLSTVANESDVEGAKLSFIRLQEVYGLTPGKMVKGMYRGYPGPALHLIDAFEIAMSAFTANKLIECKSWLEKLVKLKEAQIAKTGDSWSEPYLADIMGLLGRVYVRLGRKDEATALYRRCQGLPSRTGDVQKLQQDLVPVWPPFEPEVVTKFHKLCPLQSKMSNGNLDPRLKCRYRVIRPAYNRFKMELLSISPYAVVFHEIITTEEINAMIGLSVSKMARAVYTSGAVNVPGEFRVSDTGFLYNEESDLLVRIADRVTLITGLNTSQPEPYKFAGEPFQVVNYGMGGHYNLHLDTFTNDRTTGIHVNGNRLATFLIYLTDVKKGGSTVFSEAELVIPARKRSALFWYNFKPSGEEDRQTWHGGCPVVIGQKWVANKWVWTLDNMFFRRCGLRPDSTQYEIERYMVRGWK